MVCWTGVRQWENLADPGLGILVHPKKVVGHGGGGAQRGEKGPPKVRPMEPRLSSAKFTVLPRLVPVSSLWATESGTAHNSLIHLVTTANIHCLRVNDPAATRSLSPGHQQRAGETRRCPTAERLAKLLHWGNWVTRSRPVANIPRGWASAPSGP